MCSNFPALHFPQHLSIIGPRPPLLALWPSSVQPFSSSGQVNCLQNLITAHLAFCVLFCAPTLLISIRPSHPLSFHFYCSFLCAGAHAVGRYFHFFFCRLSPSPFPIFPTRLLFRVSPACFLRPGGPVVSFFFGTTFCDLKWAISSVTVEGPGLNILLLKGKLYPKRV